MKNNINSIVRGKKLRYGGTAAAFTVAFIAIVIIFNVIFTALATKFMWYIDMTESEIYTLCDGTKELLDNLDEEVTITFCMAKDQLEADRSMFYILNTARLLEAEYDNIKIDYRDALRDIAYLEKYTTISSPNVNTTSVIIESGTEFRLNKYENFFITDTTDTEKVWAYQGEKKFVSAILQVTADEMPIAYFTSGHGEDLTENEDAGALISLFYDAGYDVRPIDLSTEEIDSAARVLIITNPKYDFGGYYEEHTGASEIEKIDKFLDDLGSMMVFLDPGHVNKLTNLNEFLYEWCIEYTPDVMVYDKDNSVSIDGCAVVGQYNTNEEELAASIYKEITSLSSQPKTIFRRACPIEHVYEQKTFGNTNRTVTNVFTTSPDAKLIIDGATTEEPATYNLMTITQESRIIDNEYYHNYVLAAGTQFYTASQYLISNVYANSDVLYATMIAFGKERVPADIDFKVFADYTLNITTEQAASWTKFFIITLPVITIGVCVYVCVRRKYK